MASSSDADYVGKVLNEVRDQIAVDDDVLSETKARRNLVMSRTRFHGDFDLPPP